MTTEQQKPKQVYEAINAVMREMATEGIGKNHRNQQQNYSFRGIDDVYNALSSALSRNGLVMLPRILSRSCEERATAKGSALFYVTVEAEFDLVCSADGSTHTIRTFGEAMDSADKATNKAMSAAYKYAAMQAFCIPTEGDNDADATTHEVAGRAAQQQRQQMQRPRQQPQQNEQSAAPKQASVEWMKNMEAKVRGADSVETLNAMREYIKGMNLIPGQANRLSSICNEIEQALHVGA